MANYTRKATECSVEGCANGGYLTRGLCKMHYARLRRRGTAGAAEKEHVLTWKGTVCAVADCDSPVRALRYCLPHYKRLKRWGDPLAKRPQEPIEERFWAKVDKGPECWIWTGGGNATGYGYFNTTTAHRVAYSLTYGPIPDGLVIDHLCRNRRCVNPAHLEAVTNEENLARGLGYRLINGMDTKCKNGHPYDPENRYTPPSGGGSRCRACAREYDRKRTKKAS